MAGIDRWSTTGGGGLMGQLIGIGFGAGLWIALMAFEFSPHKWRKLGVRARSDVAWPAFIDDVASGLRAGLPIPQALWQAAHRLPATERAMFAQAESSWSAGAGFNTTLRALESGIGQPAFTMLCQTIELGAEHGGSRLPVLLTQLGEQIRGHLALLAEVKSRQASTVNAAKVAVMAPWLVLLLTSTRAQVRATYMTSTGLLLLAGVALVCAVSYLVMVRLARITALEVLL